MNLLVRPLTKEMRARVADDIRRQRAQFKATERQTMDLLEREIAHLGPVENADPILQVDVDTSSLLLRGGLRSSAKPETPTVALTVQTVSRGTLTFVASRYTRYEDNMRAIALTLEALRAVNRWGATESDEQYRGFEALPPANGLASVEDAALFIAGAAGWDVGTDPAAILAALSVPQVLSGAYKAASNTLHPDKGGSAEAFQKLTDAREMIEANQ